MQISNLGLVSLLGLALCAHTACFLPLSTAAPQSARTLGKGNFGAVYYSEMPTVDLLAAEEDRLEYAISPFPTASIQLGYGITDKLDIEVAADGTLYLFFLPLPIGGSVGARYQVLYNKNLAVALAGRVGYVGVPGTGGSGEQYPVSSRYGAVSAVAQLMPDGPFRPSMAVNFLPASVKVTDMDTTERFGAGALSFTVTLGIGGGPYEFGPFVNLVYFNSPNLAGSSRFVTAGAAFSIRGRKRRKPAPRLQSQPPPLPPSYNGNQPASPPGPPTPQ